MIDILMIAVAVAVLLLTRCWVLTGNMPVSEYTSDRLRNSDVEGGKHIYQGGNVGRHVATGFARPFEVCDEFLGIAYEEADNSNGSSGDKDVEVHVTGDFAIAITGVTRADVGQAVFATADDAVALSGHALAFMGRIVAIESPGVAIVRLKRPGELPRHDDGAPLCKGGPWTLATGVAGDGTEFVDGDGVLVASLLGLGVIPADGRVQLSLDNTTEVSNAGLVTPAKFDVDSGVVFKIRVAAYSTSGAAMAGAAVDLHFGLADEVVRTAVAPTRHVQFQVNGEVTTLNLGADDNTNDVPETDTTLELPKTLATAEDYTIIIRTDGTVEVYNGATAISTPSLALIDFTGGGSLRGFCNVEKTAAPGIAIVEVVNFQVFGGA